MLLQQTDNHEAIETLGEETGHAVNTLLSGVSMSNFITKQVQLANRVQSHLRDITQGIQDLVQGRLSPLLISPETLAQTQLKLKQNEK